MVEVSVICATYNHEKYIREALEGFVSQKTDFPYEVIVFDDASTDSTAAVIAEYEKRFPEIIKPLYQKSNTYAELGRFYKYFMPHINGRYIALCEGDDYWTDEHKLQKQYDFMEKHPDCSLVVHRAKRYLVGKKRFQDYWSFPFDDDAPHLLSTKFVFENHSSFPYNSMFFRKSFYDVFEEYLKKNHSYDYMMKILLATTGNVYLLPDCMSVYRYGTEGSWTNTVASDREKSIRHYEDSVKDLAKANDFTGRRFDGLFTEEIKNRSFIVAMLKRNKRLLKKPEYKEIYSSKSFKEKMIILLHLYCPFVLKLIK